MKKNMVVFIDGENISEKKSAEIFTRIKSIGELDCAKVYGLQKDNRTRAWSLRAKKDEKLKDIRLCGGPGKDKVDQKIQRDILEVVKNQKNIDIVVLVSSDHGYVPTVKKVREQGKKVVVIGNQKTSKRLKQESNEFYDL